MSIRTTEQLLDKLDGDIGWRKKELTNIVSNVKYAYNQALDKDLQFSSLRIAVTMLYAHWEGFIKNSSERYLEFISRRSLKYCDLKTNFIALALKTRIYECGKTKKISKHKDLIDFILNNLSDRAIIKYKNKIDTKSNLGSEVLKEIICMLGLDYSPYELKEKLIDLKLVKLRNDIVHGRYVSIEQSDFNILYKNIIKLMNIFKEQIIGAALSESYKSS